MALLMAICCASCGRGDAEGRLRSAAVRQVQFAPIQLPEYPAACRHKIGSGVAVGDRLDVALRRTDAALARQWGQVDDCAEWYDGLREGMSPAEE